MPRRPPRLPPLMAEFDDDERDAVLAVNRPSIVPSAIVTSRQWIVYGRRAAP